MRSAATTCPGPARWKCWPDRLPRPAGRFSTTCDSSRALTTAVATDQDAAPRAGQWNSEEDDAVQQWLRDRSNLADQRQAPAQGRRASAAASQGPRAAAVRRFRPESRSMTRDRLIRSWLLMILAGPGQSQSRGRHHGCQPRSMAEPWNGTLRKSSAISASGAIRRAICAGHALGARERASCNA